MERTILRWILFHGHWTHNEGDFFSFIVIEVKMTEMDNNYLNQEIERLTNCALSVLENYDRVQDNPDRDILPSIVSQQLSTEGKITLSLFACPSYDPSALTSKTQENYIRTEVKGTDLFTPRVPRINKLRDDLRKLGIQTDIVIFLGDSDPNTYVLPILSKYGVVADQAKLNERQAQYAQSFESRAKSLLGEDVVVFSLAKECLH
ncbi:MAG: hypothetical protein UV74_C0013G0115 [Candidatus Woesebacteria bacterium GW2011_GWB1_43_14]|uniref:Uncharacterized protein n=1 Tax=Candidatus Woesebacteria bacterium GW2011_GWB1_43_14 TaxID=1618578 RepID=A0A0G1GDN8_9BACT|nr:MAG: hypothetical protein UV51_C0005G0109 [Candidatus Woesebacteria bacterium GW2011_GWC1_42_9]KKS96993.1 MAG: hypothetical protein UV74_C0013G0115 [Candidatus Woesebacteria bacterium GW2011_GWB1_43_14]